jgi:DNA-binding CsgD family transcriptional regulator
VHVGDVAAEPVLVTNTAAADGYSESLTASVAGGSGNISAHGATGDVAAGASGAGIAVGFSTATAGPVSGSLTLALQSDRTGIDGLGITSLPSETLAVGGAVYREAAASIGSLPARFIVHVATIAGSGQIGDSSLTLVNQAGAVIDATGSKAALTINTGANSIRNSGLIEATGAAGVTLAGTLINNGTLAASAGTLLVEGALSGTGSATISGGATLDLGARVTTGQAIVFAQGATGTLRLDQAPGFAGTVAGLAAGDAIDLASFQFANKPMIAAVAALTQNGATVGAGRDREGWLAQCHDRVVEPARDPVLDQPSRLHARKRRPWSPSRDPAGADLRSDQSDSGAARYVTFLTEPASSISKVEYKTAFACRCQRVSCIRYPFTFFLCQAGSPRLENSWVKDGEKVSSEIQGWWGMGTLKRAGVDNKQLTARELEVLSWVARGKSAWEIGEILGIAKRTVDEHVATAVHKLDAGSRAHAVALAIRDGLTEI